MYGIIYADPPWPITMANPRDSKKNLIPELPYKTMSVDDCFAAIDPFLAQADDKFNVFIWTVDKFLWDAEQQMKKRGYKLHVRMIWDKGNGFPAAFTVRPSHEYLLWFYKPGHLLKPRKEAQGKYTTVFYEPSTVHSKKPVAAYKMLEDMFPDVTKIELFARNSRDGWQSWGNEVGKYS